MKLTAFLVSAVLALGVAAVDPEAGNDVEVRDFSGESLNEFDARSPGEEDDLEVRNYPPQCKGDNVEYKKVGYEWKCVCKLAGQFYDAKLGCICKHDEEYSPQYKKCIPKCHPPAVYSPKSGKCETPFTCKGENVKVVENYGRKSCECTRTGEIYNPAKGCACKDGEEYSGQYKKCIPKCHPPAVYSPKSGKCETPFTCKGDNVKVVDNYGHKSCECTRTGEVYHPNKGCSCKDGEEYSGQYKKCIPKCHHPKVYNPKSGRCEEPFTCKGDNVKVVDNYGHKSCECTRAGEVYNPAKGCACKHGEEYSGQYKKCIPVCKPGTKYDGKSCVPVCKGSHVIFKDHECRCLIPGQYYDKNFGCKNRCIGDNVFYKGDKCVCKKNSEYYNEHKGCLPRCDGDAKWNGKDCTCDYGKTYVKGKGCVDRCIKPAVFKKDQCQCPSKDQYYKEHFGCKDRCEQGTHWNGFKCVCNGGYVEHGGKCVKVPTCVGYGSSFDQKAWKCVCKAKDEKYVDGKGCVKTCGPNEKLVWEYGQAKCVCKDGYIKTKFGCQKKDGY